MSILWCSSGRQSRTLESNYQFGYQHQSHYDKRVLLGDLPGVDQGTLERN